MTSTREIEPAIPKVASAVRSSTGAAAAPVGASAFGRPRARTFLTVPVAVAATLALHVSVSKAEPALDTQTYTTFLWGALGLAVLLAAGIPLWRGLRGWMQETGPIVAAAFAWLCVWEAITTGVRWLPLPYFPSPAGVLQSLVNDWKLVLECTWHSLILLVGGYALGVAVGLVTGICIGWSVRVRYWGMPLVKFLGPIPATAWIPLAMVVSPNMTLSSIGLIGLAVWFPVSMLTASGISNTRASFLDVARTLGAGRVYLIFRVAIPAAMPMIFIGLFMGLGASFLTLVVAETIGVKSGLGWYVSWAQGWAEYGKVYGALLIMAVFFSTIMTVLFKVRDRVLVWQKGMIRW